MSKLICVIFQVKLQFLSSHYVGWIQLIIEVESLYTTHLFCILQLYVY